MFDYTVTSQKDFDTAIADLKNSLVAIKFGVLWELDIANKLKEKGVYYQGQFKILEVCNPQKAKEALETDIRVGYFLPCKIVVFVQDGETKIGTSRPSVMMKMFNSDQLQDFAETVERELITAIDNAK